jgi:hypothetical protein
MVINMSPRQNSYNFLLNVTDPFTKLYREIWKSRNNSQTRDCKETTRVVSEKYYDVSIVTTEGHE